MPSRRGALLIALAAALSLTGPALAQEGAPPHGPHGMEGKPASPDHSGHVHGGHTHEVGPAGTTYELRFIDAMVQHHTGALRMGEFMVNIGEPGVGALATQIWREQAEEIRAMGLWRLGVPGPAPRRAGCRRDLSGSSPTTGVRRGPALR